MNSNIPNSLIGAVSSVIAEHYYSHSKLDTLFMESGAPGDVPEGNCEKKCSVWLKRCNDDSTVSALDILAEIIQEYMDKDLEPSFYGDTSQDKIKDGRLRISNALAKSQLSYRMNGHITLSGSTPISKTLEDYLSSGDFSSIEKEFERAVDNIDSDPHASITAACSIIESTLKFYIQKCDLLMPQKLNVIPLWSVVQSQISLNQNSILANDQHKILKGITAIIDGVGAFRSHIGSAHGREIAPPKIVTAEARLAVNSAHTIVVFVMEMYHGKNT